MGTVRTFQFVAYSSVDSEPRCFRGCFFVVMWYDSQHRTKLECSVFGARAVVKSHDATWASATQRYPKYHMNLILNSFLVTMH